MKRTPLARNTPLRRTPIKAKRRRPNPGPRPDPESEFWHGQRRILFDRCGGRCERCGVRFEGVKMEAHHRHLRSQGGPDDIENLVALCDQIYGNGCHTGSEGVHSRVTEARAAGFIVPSWLDFRTFAVQLHDGRTVRLLEDGTYDVVFDR